MCKDLATSDDISVLCLKLMDPMLPLNDRNICSPLISSVPLLYTKDNLHNPKNVAEEKREVK